mgnify:FL=1
MSKLIKLKSFEKNIIKSLNNNIPVSFDDNKKLSIFVVVLLELLFKNNINISNQILNYLKNDNIINKEIFNDEYSKIKFMLSNMVKTLSPNQIENNIKSSYRYNYNEINKIAEGSFGSVHKVLHNYDNTYYAIKKIFITEELLEDNYNFLKEIQIFSKLYHSNIVRYFTSFISIDENSINDFNSDEENEIKIENTTSILFIQMELCDKTLYDYINYETKQFNNSLKYFEELLQGIQYLHSLDIIHRDIKPSNIYLLNNQVKIGDFGLSTIKKDNINKMSDDIGTNFYLAPEILTGEYDNKIDIYSLGIILIELLLETQTISEKYQIMKNILKQKNFNKHKFNKIIKYMLCDKNKRLNINDLIYKYKKIQNNYISSSSESVKIASSSTWFVSKSGLILLLISGYVLISNTGGLLPKS